MKEELLDKDLSCLNLPAKSYNALIKAYSGRKSIKTVRELLELNPTDLMNYRNLGQKGIQEILMAVHDQGLKFDFEKTELEKIDDLIAEKESKIEMLNKELELLREKRELIVLSSSEEEKNIKA